MSLFATPDWEPNAIGDKRSSDLSTLATQSKKKRKKQKPKERIREGNTKEENRKIKKVKAIVKSNLGKQKVRPLVKIKREDKRKMKNIESKKEPHAHLKINRNRPQSNKTFNSDYEIQRSPTRSTGGNTKASKFKAKFLKLQAPSAHVISSRKKSKTMTLRERMMEKLKASRFRFLNESMYTSSGKEAERYFQKDPESFKAYHDGFQQQVSRWPLNPLDIVIKSVQKLPQSSVVADFGCGDARLAQSVKCKVHSFDLVAINEHVTACNMANVPLEDGSVDMAVFCLSLMGTNLREYILEANRVLKLGGVLKIVEVESRFDNVDVFIKDVQQFGFSKTRKDSSQDLFYFVDFKKSADCKQKQKLPQITLHPCLYKKR